MSLNFTKYSSVYYIFSGILVIGTIVSLSLFGLNFGIDFSGGSVLEVEFSAKGESPPGADAPLEHATGGDNRPQNAAIQEKLNEFNLGEIVIQPAGEKSVVLRMKEINEDIHQEIISKLGEISPIKELSFENIGPVVGRELRQKTVVLIIVSLIALLFYISVSFRKISKPVSSWQYGVISIITLTFDILITVGLLAVLGKFYNVQFNIPIITALLTILGYTINDKVIVFDRVRENLLRKRSENFKELVNQSLNETIGRSLSTGTCSLLVLLSIFLFGGDTLKYFSLTLITGIVIGTYSSLFLATPLLVSWLGLKERKNVQNP